MSSVPKRAAARRVVASLVLFAIVVGIAFGLWWFKQAGAAAAAAAAASQPEMGESAATAVVAARPHARTTTTIGTVKALRSITLRNELPGTVRAVTLLTGQRVEAGQVLVELDVSVEQAEQKAMQAEAALAATMLARMERAQKDQGASEADVDRARAQRDMAAANVARLDAVIERKRLKAPFAAKVGLVDLHVGQYLDPGAEITTLQGIDDAVHVEFKLPQEAAARLVAGSSAEITFGGRKLAAKIVDADARIEATTRNTTIRARLEGEGPLPLPGAAVRVEVPVEAAHEVLVVPVSALRRSPAGDSVWVVANGKGDKLRATERRVRAGALLGDEVILLEGVAVGERVATAGSFKLRENVIVTDPAAAKAQ
jgi:membrane fusion protein, multidrug efflux system